MGLISTFRRLLGRDQTPGPGDDFWYNPLTKNYASVKVTPETAMRCTAVLGCVKVISESIAGLPVVLYRRKSKGRKREIDHVVSKLITNKPCPWMTSFEWREMMTAFVLLRGNAYAQKVKTRRGELVSLNPLNPENMRLKLNSETSEIEYYYKVQGKQEVLFDQDDIFHLKGYTTDGISGISVIAMAGTAIGLSIAAEEYGAKVFTNDATPGGILSHPARLSDEAHKRIQKSWQDAHSGIENAHKVAITEEGMSWTKVGMSSEDVQFIDSRKFQVEEIARMFRVPPHMIQDLSRATFSNIEHQSLSFVQHTLLPWLKRWEGSINARMIPDSEQESLYIEFLVDGLLRGDIQSRYTAYQVGRQNGWLSANDIRKLENMEPLEGEQGDMYIVQANMVDAEKLASGEISTGNVTENTPKEPEKDPENDEKIDENEQKQRKINVFTEALRAILIKNSTKEYKATIKLLNRNAQIEEFESFYNKFVQDLREDLIQQCKAFSETIHEKEQVTLTKRVEFDLGLYTEIAIGAIKDSMKARAESKLKDVWEDLIKGNVDSLVKSLVHTIVGAEL